VITPGVDTPGVSTPGVITGKGEIIVFIYFDILLLYSLFQCLIGLVA
jgi:hypothetical protein